MHFPYNMKTRGIKVMDLIHFGFRSFVVLACSNYATIAEEGSTCNRIQEDIRLLDLQFSCWGAPCSSQQNEGYWLGIHASLRNSHHFLERKISTTESVGAINHIWASFINMSTHGRLSTVNENIEKLEIPKYAKKLHHEKPDQSMIPMICHPKEFLYCDNSLHSGHRESGKCRCNLLYSEPLVRDGSGDEICIGRPNTPCGFELVDSFPDEEDLLGQPAVNPIGLRDGTHAPCIKDATCLPFKDRKERDLFRQGTIWHGFGHSPIAVEMIQRSATRICKCKQGFAENVMHDCVPISAVITEAR